MTLYKLTTNFSQLLFTVLVLLIVLGIINSCLSQIRIYLGEIRMLVECEY